MAEPRTPEALNRRRQERQLAAAVGEPVRQAARRQQAAHEWQRQAAADDTDVDQHDTDVDQQRRC